MSLDTLKQAYRIYVVEDSPILLRLLLEMVDGIPRALIVGYSGRAKEAIGEIVQSAPDAIIVDLMLQSGTGFDVLEALGRAHAMPPTAIVLTNFTLARYRERAASLGANHFFDKSTEILKMFRVMSKLVQEHQRRPNSNRNHG
jgi:two-component system, OmpR family, response regulator